MEYIKVDNNNPNKKFLDKIVEFLKKGKVIAYPTDTIYGLGCDALNMPAIKKIYKIKQRHGKGFIILVSSLAMAKKYCKI